MAGDHMTIKTRIANLEKAVKPAQKNKTSVTPEQIDYGLKILEKLTRQNLLVAAGESIWSEIQALFLFGDDMEAKP
jgi:hypothetical protein